MNQSLKHVFVIKNNIKFVKLYINFIFCISEDSMKIIRFKNKVISGIKKEIIAAYE